MPTSTRKRRGLGAIRKLPSKRWQASYVGPDSRRHSAPSTFDTRGDAEAWLAAQQTDISREEWQRPAPKRPAIPTLGAYAERWLTERTLRPRPRAEYRKLLNTHLRPAFGDERLDDITPAAVRGWYATLGTTTGATARSHAYAFLRAVLNTAVADELLPLNPCRVRGAGRSKRVSQTKPATIAELGVIVEAMRPRFRLAVLLAAWCGLRFGEIAELRCKDIDVKAGLLHIQRAVVCVGGEQVVGPPKSDAGVRDVAIPPHLLPEVKQHLRQHTARGPEALLFPAPSGSWLRSDGALHRDFYEARTAAGREELRFHDLRHTGATLAAATGATLAELMRRLGHSTPAAAMRYQHAADDRDKAIAAALSGFHSAKVVQLRPKRATA